MAPLPEVSLPALPVLAAAAGDDGGTFERALFSLFILFVAAKIGEELFDRLGLPGVIGELLGGFLVGPYALGLAEITLTAEVFAEIGAVILLFVVGLEVRIADLMAVRSMALGVGVIGFILPIVAGMAAGLLLEPDLLAAAIVGLALAATSIGITSRVLSAMGVLERPFSRVILGAAVADDILGLLAIGLLSGFAGGGVGMGTALTLGAGVAFVFVGLALARLARRLPRSAFTWPRFAESAVVPVFVIMFAGALLAQSVGLAAIIGAFVVGLIVAETPARDEVSQGFRPLLGVFTPFFFAVTGAAIDLSALLDPRTLVVVLALTLLAVLTKLVAGILGARPLGRWQSIIVGVGMSPRGEVGIVVAALGLSLTDAAGAPLIGSQTYAVLLTTIILTTLVAPFMLQWAIPRDRGQAGTISQTPPTPADPATSVTPAAPA
jgi:Kef-type K+ transport system membrane component KefB